MKHILTQEEALRISNPFVNYLIEGDEVDLVLLEEEERSPDLKAMIIAKEVWFCGDWICGLFIPDNQ